MPLRIYLLGWGKSVAAGATDYEVDRITTPADVSRRLREVRLYSSSATGVRIKLMVETLTVMDVSAEELSTTKLPYPLDEEIPTGKAVRLVVTNNTGSAVTVHAVLIFEETATR